MRLFVEILQTGRILAVGCLILLASIRLDGPVLAQNDQPSPADPVTAPVEAKSEAEIRKLELEIGKLERENESWIVRNPLTIPIALTFLGLVGNAIILLINLRAKAKLDKFTALIEPRLEAYAKAFTLLQPTALFFPPAGRPDKETGVEPELDTPVLDQETCRKMGRGLSDWYFGAGGVLMTKRARDAYFDLMRALGWLADTIGNLEVQTIKQHGSALTPDLIDVARRKLEFPRKETSISKNVEWRDFIKRFFSEETRRQPHEEELNADDYKDFVLIQTLASRLRTELTKDIESRDAPEGET